MLTATEAQVMKAHDIPPTKIVFSAEDRATILARIDQCLADGHVAAGRYVEELEAAFADYNGSTEAIAVSSGGSALEACLFALAVKGGEVLVPTNTFFATASAVLAAGGEVKLLDIDPHTAAPTCDIVRRGITARTMGVVLVHVGGIITPEIGEIRTLCEERGLWLLEDCAHAHGSEFAGIRAGNFGMAGAYSLCSTKVITSGEGGLIVTKNHQFAKKLRLLRNYGKPEAWVTYCVSFGLNWRMNELAAIVGRQQLARLDEFIKARAEVAGIYRQELSGRGDLEFVQPKGRCSWYKCIVLLPESVNRERVKDHLRSRGVRVAGGVYEIPLHKQPVGASLDGSDSFPGADYFCANHICLPVYYGMSPTEAQFVARELIAAL